MEWDLRRRGMFEDNEVLEEHLDLEYENVLGDLIVISKK
jgi:hypothetical protein